MILLLTLFILYTNLNSQATLAASFAKVEATGEVVVNAELETLASLPALQPLTFEVCSAHFAFNIDLIANISLIDHQDGSCRRGRGHW